MVSDIKLISLVSSLYKIIAKVLAKRLKKVLPSIIHDSQAGFVEDRQILDTILVAYEVVGDRRARKWNAKLDLQKAYNKVDWSFLDVVLD